MTIEEALATAAEYGLEYEVEQAIIWGDTPEEALEEWDIILYKTKI